MSENPELEVDEEQVDLDPDPAPEDGLGEDDFAPFDYTDSYTDVDPNYVPIVDPGGEPDDGDEDLTDEEAEPPEEEDELVPYWVSYEMQGRNLDEGSAWQNLATEPFSAELEVEVEGLTAGARWEFRLRLVDRNGQRSRWSEPLQISLPTDFTPPPAPTAPSVDENTGYITSWWDGELTGDMPKDFSHIVKYLQQMHPDGDPDGEPGDPYRFSTMSSAGAFSVGFLLADVQYRTWFTAVDTTGNESPWSDIVEFTPSQAFNTDELEAELEHLNTERLPELERSLTEEVGKATQAVADFRTEWDESGWDPEVMADLEARQGTLESSLAEGFQRVEGDLQEFRTEWDESGWDAEEFNNLRTRAGELEVNLQQGLADAEQSVRSLAITGPRNINSDPKFETLDNEDIASWRSTADAWYHVNTAWGTPNREFLRISGDVLGDGLYTVSYGGNGPANAVLECTPGEVFKARFQVLRYAGGSSSDDYRLQFRWIDGDRNGISWSNISFGAYVNQAWVEAEVTAPEGAAYFYFRFTKRGTASGARGFGNVSVRAMTTGDLTVDGSMLARHIDVEDLTASTAFLDHAMVNLIQGRMAEFDQAIIGGALLKEGAVTASKLAVIPDLEDYAPNPGAHPGLWTLLGGSIVANTGNDYNPSNVAFRFGQRSGNTQIRGPIRSVTPGKQIKFRGRYSWYGSSSTGATVRVRMEWSEDPTPGRDGYSTFVSIPSGSSPDWYEGTVTVPEWAEYGRLYLYQDSTTGSDAAILGTIQCEPMVGSVLIENGAIKAQHGDFADITASAAFLDHAMVNLIQGRMANFDEAIIGGTLLKDNAVATRHLTVTNTENLWRDEWLDDILDTDYIFSPAGNSTSSAFNTRFHSASPSSVQSGNVEWQWATLQGDRGYQTWPNRNSGTNQRIAFRHGPGKGILVRPGEQYTFRARVRDHNDGGFLQVVMALFDVETGDSITGGAPFIELRGTVHGSTGELIWTFEIPNEFPRMHMVPSIHSGANGDSSARTLLRPQLFKAHDGKLIVDGLLQASTGELQQLFFDTAVGNAISLGIADILTINADRINSNSWNGQVMTGPVMQSHSADNTGWRIEPGLGLRMWDNSGTETIRLDGTDNFFAGRVHAGIGQAQGIVLDHGLVEISRGWTDEEEPPEILEEHTTHFIEFHGVEGNLYDPKIYVDEDTGGLSVSPGRKVGTASGSGSIRLWGHTRANRLISRAVEVPTGSDLQPGGMRRDGGRTRLQGRTPAQSGTLDMFTSGSLGPYTPSGGNYRGGTSWAYPPPQGSRPLVVSARVTTTSTTDFWRGAVASWSLPPSSNSADGFRFTLRFQDGSGGQTMWLQYIARWE